jgi:HNH endonuclease
MSSYPKRPLLTAARVRELLDCDPEAGTLRWRERPGNAWFNSRFAGREAGYIRSDGYRQVMIDGRLHLVHRAIWLHCKGYFPPDELDHRDGNPRNNAIANLRPASHAENLQNRRAAPRLSAPRGCHLHRSGKFRAEIKAGGKRFYLGMYPDVGTAQQAYLAAAAVLHGEFAFFRGAAA